MAESQEPQAPPEAKVSEAQIAVHWREEEYYPPPPKFVEQANANDRAIFERFTEDKFPGCFKEYADLLTWDQRRCITPPGCPPGTQGTLPGCLGRRYAHRESGGDRAGPS